MATIRKDALRSRQAIIDAAGTLFAEDADASIAEVGVLAGLNQATVYRHFPDRSELFAAVLEGTLERFESEVESWDLTPDSFERLLRLMSVEQARFCGLTSRVRQGDLDPARRTAVRDRTLGLFRDSLDVAKERGVVRRDFDSSGVLLLLNMVDGVVGARGEDAATAASEAIDLIMAGLRPKARATGPRAQGGRARGRGHAGD